MKWLFYIAASTAVYLYMVPRIEVRHEIEWLEPKCPEPLSPPPCICKPCEIVYQPPDVVEVISCDPCPSCWDSPF